MPYDKNPKMTMFLWTIIFGIHQKMVRPRMIISKICCQLCGLHPDMVVAYSWYSSLKNLKAIRSYGWNWVMGIQSNRLVGKPHQ